MSEATKGAVLAFNFKGDRLAALQDLCDRRGATLKNVLADVEPETFSLSLGAILAGGTVTTSETLNEDARSILRGMAFSEEMIILAGLFGDDLDAFLEDLKSTVLWIPLKAVLTPTNTAWTPAALKGELEGERAAIAEAFAKQQAKAELSVKPGAEDALKDLGLELEDLVNNLE